MQDALPALVLNSEALPRTVMNETPTNETNAAGRPVAASTTSDEQLMLAFSKGSSYAFDELFFRYKQPIYGFFRRRILESSQVEELTQETFIALLRAAARFSAPISTPSVSRFSAPIAARPPSAPRSSAKETPRPTGCGSAALSRSLKPWIAKSCSCVNSTN